MLLFFILLQSKLDGFLAAPDHLMFPHTRCLLSSTFRRQLQTRTAQAVVSVYKMLYDLVQNPQNCYPEPATLMAKNPDMVKSLLM